MIPVQNIRELLGGYIGQRVADITQDDWEDIEAQSEDPAERTSSVYLHFENGKTIGVRVMGCAGIEIEAES